MPISAGGGSNKAQKDVVNKKKKGKKDDSDDDEVRVRHNLAHAFPSTEYAGWWLAGLSRAEEEDAGRRTWASLERAAAACLPGELSGELGALPSLSTTPRPMHLPQAAKVKAMQDKLKKK